MSLKNQHTFVICAYGDSPFLEECILSLVNQELKSQVILYTSTPSDYIEKLCLKYNIPYHSKVGGGIGKDWNNALSFVKTKYATIAHQDDYYLPNYSLEIMEKASKVPDSLIIYSDYFEEKDGQKIAKTTNLKIKTVMLKGINILSSNKIWRRRILAFGNAICCPAVTYNLEKLKGFQFDENLKGNLDWIAWYKIGNMNGSFSFVPKGLMCHRIHQESETSKTISDNTRSKEDLETFEIFWPKWIARLIMRQYVKAQKSND